MNVKNKKPTIVPPLHNAAPLPEGVDVGLVEKLPQDLAVGIHHVVLLDVLLKRLQHAYMREGSKVDERGRSTVTGAGDSDTWDRRFRHDS